MPNLVEIGQTAAEIWRFFDFSRWRPPPSWIFKFQTFNGRTALEGRSASPCQIWSKSVKTRRRYGDFSIFQHGGRPPSWICYVCVRTTYKGYLVVFIAVQNLVGIDAVILIICMFFDFTSLAWKPLFTPQKYGGFGGFDPLNGVYLIATPERH